MRILFRKTIIHKQKIDAYISNVYIRFRKKTDVRRAHADDREIYGKLREFVDPKSTKRRQIVPGPGCAVFAHGVSNLRKLFGPKKHRAASIKFIQQRDASADKAVEELPRGGPAVPQVHAAIRRADARCF